jgi:succinate dehydrogenase / fumarate reductase cytochrome b subunit
VADNILERHHYLLRRLHSLTGVVPIGVFMIIHLTTNSSIVWGLINGSYGDVHAGAATFQHEVNFIHSLPFLILIEIFGLWLPIAFHSLLGIYYATSGKPNNAAYKYQANWRYTLQRISGYVGVLFLFYHVATLRWGWSFLVPGGAKWSAEHAGSTLALALQGSAEGMTAGGLIVSAFYMLGVSLLVFHLANGLWTAAITWGLTITASAQRRWGYACAALGVGLMGAAWASVIGFATIDPAEARAAEEHVNWGHAVQSETAEAPDRPGSGDSETAPGTNPSEEVPHDG